MKRRKRFRRREAWRRTVSAPASIDRRTHDEILRLRRDTKRHPPPVAPREEQPW
jgi:hypothetical protein